MVLWEFWSEKQTASAFCQNYAVSTVLAHGSLGLLTYTIKDNLLVECIDIGAIWRQYFLCYPSTSSAPCSVVRAGGTYLGGDMIFVPTYFF